MREIIIRPVSAMDRADWQKLWTAYLAFYETELPPAVYDTTFARLLDDGEFEPNGLLAFTGGQAVGLVHYILHRTCWSAQNNCYLQDLFAMPEMRGKGVGRALIKAVYERGFGGGAREVYWMTHETNADAQHLYRKVARRSGFIEYTKLQDEA